MTDSVHPLDAEIQRLGLVIHVNKLQMACVFCAVACIVCALIAGPSVVTYGSFIVLAVLYRRREIRAKAGDLVP